MKDLSDKNIEIFPPDIHNALKENVNFYIQFAFFNKPAEALFMKTMRAFLARYDVLYLKDILITITKELITNAVKANAKRLYFKTKNLTITDKLDYRKGMENFKKDVIRPDSSIQKELVDTRYRVRVLFSREDENLIIKIINNIPIVDEEITKINARIKKAYRYDNITDALNDVLDDSEGAGLGLIMSLMVFKNAGFPPENLKIYSDGKKTIGSITISSRTDQKKIQVKVADEIIRELDSLPSFPENIQKIKKLCENPNSTIQQVSTQAQKDPGLTSSLLKLANSPEYYTVGRISSIEGAVKLIGLEGLKTLVIAGGVHNIMQSRYKQFKKIWDASYKKAFYAQKIAILYQYQDIEEICYLAALLSDIGKIVLLSVEKEVVHKLVHITGLKEMSNPDVLEEMTLGISHTTLGSLISQKWKFDTTLIQTIEYYVKPHLAPDTLKDLIYIVHLAHIYTEFEKRQYRYEIVDNIVLTFFKLTTEQSFIELHHKLEKAYNQHLATH